MVLLRFQSTPVIANGRIFVVMPIAESSPRFQSTPVIANGRIHAAFLSVFGSAISFNPRPLLLTGESATDSQTSY